MIAESRFNTTWIGSLLLVLVLTVSMGHVHNDEVPAELCAVCALSDHADALVGGAYVPLAMAAGVAPEPAPVDDSTAGTTTHYLSRAPPRA